MGARAGCRVVRDAGPCLARRSLSGRQLFRKIEMAALQKLLLSNEAHTVRGIGTAADLLLCKALWTAPVTRLADIQGAVAPETSIGTILERHWSAMKCAAGAAMMPFFEDGDIISDLIYVSAAVAAGRQPPVSELEWRAAALFGHRLPTDGNLSTRNFNLTQVAFEAARGGHVHILAQLLGMSPPLDVFRNALEGAMKSACLDTMQWLMIRLPERTTSLANHASMLTHSYIPHDVSDRANQEVLIIKMCLQHTFLRVEETVQVTAELLRTSEHTYDALFNVIRADFGWRYQPQATAVAFAAANNKEFANKIAALEWLFLHHDELRGNAKLRAALLEHPSIPVLELIKSQCIPSQWTIADWSNSNLRREHLQWMHSHMEADEVLDASLPILWAANNDIRALEWCVSHDPLLCAPDWSELEVALGGEAGKRTVATLAVERLRQLATVPRTAPVQELAAPPGSGGKE